MSRLTEIQTAAGSGSVPEPSKATLDMLATLVGFDTTSHRSNLDLIDFVYEYLQKQGVQSRLDFNKERSKANLYAVVGPHNLSGIALSGHTDVVPTAGQEWTRDPWQAGVQDGRVYGRGTTDMKGFLAVVLASVPAMLSASLARPIHLCFSYDEEIGCIGVRSLLEYLAQQEDRPSACVVGEPTGMQVINGHKGKLSMRCQVRGHACHSAMAPQGVNAVEAAARVISQLMVMARRKREQGPHDAGFDIPYTTIHTGVVRGGSTVNVVPAECHFDFEFRNLPGEDPRPLLEEIQLFAEQQVAPDMRAVAAETGFRWQELAWFPGLDIDAEEDIAVLTLQLAEAGPLRKVAFGTEAGGYHDISIPTVVCGPGHIDQAHIPDEFIEIEQLARCERFIDRLVRYLTRTSPDR